MGLNCGAKFLKYCLFAFNLVFFIAGIVCLGIGIWLIVTEGDAINDIYDALAKAGKDIDKKDMVESDRAFRDLGVLMAFAGGFVVVIAFLGCCGAVKEWRPLLIAYSVCLLIILAIELAAAIYAIANRSSVNERVKEAMEKSLKYYGKNEGIKTAWDSLMKKQSCCGVISGDSQDEFAALNLTTAGLPGACCPPGLSEGQTCPDEKAYTVGCHNSLRDWLNEKMAVVIGVGAAIAVFLVVGIIFALCLCQSISKDQSSYA